MFKNEKKVLQYGDNGKGFFRKGQALYHLNKYKEALENLERANSLLAQDQIGKCIIGSLSLAFLCKI